MNINASIVDQRLTGILQSHGDCLPQGDENRKRATAFVLLSVATCLDLSLEEAAELVTEGGQDAGVDALHISDVDDGEFLVTIFQGKYKIKNLAGDANFPENGIEKAVNTVRVLFDPYRQVQLNERIKPKIEEIRSLIRDSYIPTVRVILCNNGLPWKAEAKHWIEEAQKEFADKVSFHHFNHDNIVKILQRKKSIDTQLILSGKILVEDMNYMRVLVGRVSAQEIYKLFDSYGDRLLERNIRRYLGLNANRVNIAIHNTLINENTSDKFYFYNNGITVVCDKFDYNAFQREDYTVQLKNMQIINGGQTCRTIQETLSKNPNIASSAYIMIRIYQLAESEKDFTQEITYATNSQTPVDLQDLKSNDEKQKQLEIGMEDLGYKYKRYRDIKFTNSSTISSSVVAESVLAIWRKKPHQAKLRRKEHFGKLYHDIFGSLNAAQAILATQIFRVVENERKQTSLDNTPDFLPYASHYVAMVIGDLLLTEKNTSLNNISHKNFEDLNEHLTKNTSDYLSKAYTTIQNSLHTFYGNRKLSLQQIAATFRRGDLIEILNNKHKIADS